MRLYRFTIETFSGRHQRALEKFMDPRIFDGSIGCCRISVDRQAIVWSISIEGRVIVDNDDVVRFISMLVSLILFLFFLR